jgi:hypothetical protein
MAKRANACRIFEAGPVEREATAGPKARFGTINDGPSPRQRPKLAP